MDVKKFLLIIVLITFSLVVIFLLLHCVREKQILYYQSYSLNKIDVTDNYIIIEGGFAGASGIGQDCFDYSVDNDSIYLSIYQQNQFSSKPLNGSIDIKLTGDFSNIKYIYLNQPKGEPINIWGIT